MWLTYCTYMIQVLVGGARDANCVHNKKGRKVLQGGVRKGEKGDVPCLDKTITKAEFQFIETNEKGGEEIEGRVEERGREGGREGRDTYLV